uniref:Orphan protein n=1 Tax=Heterorhabditis bacteriophora TaxID=37862 RepID=A0A1I7WHM6_HETBA
MNLDQHYLITVQNNFTLLTQAVEFTVIFYIK